MLYYTQGQYAETESLYKRALAIDERALGPHHPDVATDLNNLAGLYYGQGQYGQAEPLLKRALAIREQALGPHHPDTKASRESVATISAKMR
jgi:tetratricopeptide (TPR) repeat protein